MTIAETLKRRTELKGAAVDVLSMAHHFGMLHSELLARLAERVWKPAEKLPYHCRAYLHGYVDSRMDAFWSQNLEYRYFYQGEWVNAYDVPAGGDAYREVAETGCHFWKAEHTTLVQRPARPFTRAVEGPVREGRLVA